MSKGRASTDGYSKKLIRTHAVVIHARCLVSKHMPIAYLSLYIQQDTKPVFYIGLLYTIA